MYKRGVQKGGGNMSLVRTESSGSETTVGNLMYIEAEEYLGDQPKFWNVSGSGEANEGQHAIKTARPLLYMGTWHRDDGMYVGRGGVGNPSCTAGMAGTHGPITNVSADTARADGTDVIELLADGRGVFVGCGAVTAMDTLSGGVPVHYKYKANAAGAV